MPYLDWQSRPDVRLPWQDNDDGRRWNEALGLVKDLVVDRAEQAVRCRWVSKAPESALARIGQMRRFPRAPNETVAEYRARLRLAWYLAQWQGTATGVIAALNALGLSNVSIREAISPTWGRNESALSDDAKKRHFWVIIDQPHPFGTDFSFRYDDGTTYGAAPTGSGKLWGVSGDARLVEIVRALVKQMRPSHAYCADIIVILSGTIVDGTGTTSDGDPTGASDRVAYLGGI